MKEGWEYKKLGEVIEHLRTGLNPRTHFKLNTPDAEGYYVTVRELKGFAIEPDEKTDKVNKSAIKRINERSNLKIGDVLFSGTGTIGKTALVTELPENWNIKEGVYAMTPKHSELDSKYFIYYIGSDLFLRLVNDKAAGTGVRSIPMKELVKLPISVPPLSEQQSIVDYLDSAFAKIDAMKANAEKALDEAKALFQASLKEMLEPEEGWNVKPLKEICRVINGRAYSKDEMLKQGKYRLLRVGNFFTNDSWYYSDLELEEDKYCDNGDLLYAWSASFGPRIWDGEKVIYHYHIWKMVFSAEIDKYFMCYWLDSDELKKQTMTNLHGATMAHITKGIIEAAHVSFPSLPEQQSIVTTLDSLKSKVDRLQENYDKISQECDALKQAILRQVFE